MLKGTVSDLKERFNEDFWLDEHRWFAIGLDRDKRPWTRYSNIGHCLSTGSSTTTRRRSS